MVRARNITSRIVCIALITILFAAATAHAQLVLGGPDCWTSSDCAQQPAQFLFTENPIPADFFNPGSEPFVGTIELQGQTGGIDVQIVRLNDINFPPALPATEFVPIQLIQLDLVSCQPITVIVAGQPTLWDVQVDLSPTPTPPGQMTIDKLTPNGGKFGFDFPVQPRFTFTKVGDPGTVRVFDTGLEAIPPIVIFSNGQDPWAHNEALDPCVGDNFSPGVRDSVCEPLCCAPVLAQGKGFEIELRVPGCTQECDDGLIPAGIDEWATPCGQSFFDFNPDPIPENFFDPGSLPFEGVIELGGDGLGADTRIERLQDMLLPEPGNVATVPIQIVELNLQSCSPITVVTNGNPIEWDVQIDLSTIPPPASSLTATKTHCNGGTYSSVLQVQPRFTFTRVDDPLEVRVLDSGQDGRPPVVLTPFEPIEDPDIHFCVDDFFDIYLPAIDCTVEPPQCTDVCRQSIAGPPMKLLQLPVDCLPTCPADITNSAGGPPDGQVNVFDLLELLSSWGQCPLPCPPSCPADITNAAGTGTDCEVNVFDLLNLLANWGSC